MADDLGREPIPGVTGAGGCHHPTRLLTPICRCKRSKASQVDGAPEIYPIRELESGVQYRNLLIRFRSLKLG